MEALLNILTDLHPDVDFDTCTTLIDDKILDSFDIVTLVAEIDAEFDVAIPAEELVPEMLDGKNPHLGTAFFAIGFCLMMSLDIALG